jgi:anti-sigma regulatory factor (Ser/Thr protein kinase)
MTLKQALQIIREISNGRTCNTEQLTPGVAGLLFTRRPRGETAQLQQLCGRHAARFSDTQRWLTEGRTTANSDTLDFRSQLVHFGTSPTGAALNSFTSSLSQRAIEAGVNESRARKLCAALHELLDNVHEHAGERPEEGARAFAAFDINREQIEVLISDCGVGILASLRRNPANEHIETEKDAMHAAVLNRASGRLTGGAGTGFQDLLAFLSAEGAHVEIHSGKAYMRTRQAGLAIRAEHETHPEIKGLSILVKVQISPDSSCLT